MIPLDGKVIEGSISVKSVNYDRRIDSGSQGAGGYVYAGTVVEDGNSVIEVAQSLSGKYDQIAKIIEESEKLKSETEERAFHLADRLSRIH